MTMNRIQTRDSIIGNPKPAEPFMLFDGILERLDSQRVAGPRLGETNRS